MQQELNEAQARFEQYRSQIWRLENRVRDLRDSERKKRNYRLITCGAEVESMAPEVRGMSERAFRLLAEQIFSLPEVADLVEHMADPQEED